MNAGKLVPHPFDTTAIHAETAPHFARE